MTEDSWSDWHRRALCAQIPAELFFLKKGEPGKEARKACKMCPVRQDCLTDRLTGNAEDAYGISGGFGPIARAKMHALVRAGQSASEVAASFIAKAAS